ncbi:DUF1007 family protein [Nitratireductor basaltis]|uniref:ABC transporter substrate-binding protein n=1 Tax=Nitratireductor basaltis TaxID=472175 RepID=A0A084U868_9HYPH|nr:DUF1007 family protein [Nitratireductor basaltis]KFB09154.1 hypothetical protein EL18_00169 [Nitratireductor basaltis]
MHALNRPKTIAAAAIFALGGSSTSIAHPHVFAEARLDVVVENGQVQGLRHLWRFDDLFSSTVLVEFDSNKDLTLDSEELEEVAKVVNASIAEFNHFQIVTAGGKDVDMVKPDTMIADFTDNQLIIMFESHPASAIPLDEKVTFGVYDPTFYTAIDFTEDEYLSVENLPESCTKQVIRPDADEAIAQNQQSLTDAFFDDPGGNDLSKIFATKLEIDCKANG